MSVYADRIADLAPDADPAHVEAWMRLEYGTLDALSPARFAAEVSTALECIDHAGQQECDKLARSYGLWPRQRYDLGDEVLVAREGGLAPAAAVIDGENEHRPHLVKVKYLRSRTGAWIARARIVGRVADGASEGGDPVSDQRRRGRAWKPDATGRRCVRCACTWGGHAGSSCYPVLDPAIDASDLSRSELLRARRRRRRVPQYSPSRPGDPVE